MTTYVINGEESQVVVDITFPLENDRKDVIFIQPKSKAKIPAYSVVDPNFLFHNPKVRVHKMDNINEFTTDLSQPIAQ